MNIPENYLPLLKLRKMPLSQRNKEERKTLSFKISKFLLQTFLKKATFIKLKWRWCRGEIRELRLQRFKFASMAAPLKRFIDYNKIGEKAFKVEEMKFDGKIYEQ